VLIPCSVLCGALESQWTCAALGWDYTSGTAVLLVCSVGMDVRPSPDMLMTTWSPESHPRVCNSNNVDSPGNAVLLKLPNHRPSRWPCSLCLSEDSQEVCCQRLLCSKNGRRKLCRRTTRATKQTARFGLSHAVATTAQLPTRLLPLSPQIVPGGPDSSMRGR
jgi:hypothetical protein